MNSVMKTLFPGAIVVPDRRLSGKTEGGKEKLRIKCLGIS